MSVLRISVGGVSFWRHSYVTGHGFGIRVVTQDSIKKRRKKKTYESHRNSDDDTIGTVGKISTSQIQRYQKRSPMVIIMDHMNGPKARELWLSWPDSQIHDRHIEKGPPLSSLPIKSKHSDIPFPFNSIKALRSIRYHNNSII
jgi:hypothetical protein